MLWTLSTKGKRIRIRISYWLNQQLQSAQRINWKPNSLTVIIKYSVFPHSALFVKHIFLLYLSWVQGAACSVEFLPWYPFWQDEKTCFSSCCTWLSREHFWKMCAVRVCSEKACSNICIKANTTFKGEEIELNLWFLNTEPASLRL